MIRVILTGVKWGIDPVDEGAQINLLDEQSGMLYHVPFTGDSLVALMTQLSEHMSEEQKQAIAPLFQTNGLALPGRDFSVEDIVQSRQQEDKTPKPRRRPVRDNPQA